MAPKSAGITDELYPLLGQPTETTLKELKRKQRHQIQDKFFTETGMPACDSSRDEYIEWLEDYIIHMHERILRLEQDSVELSWLKNPERMGR